MRRLELVKLVCFSLLCAVRLAGVFCAAAVAAACACSGILMAYRVYEEESLASLSRSVLAGYLKFGIAAGAFAGVVAAGFWFAKNFSSMYKKTIARNE